MSFLQWQTDTEVNSTKLIHYSAEPLESVNCRRQGRQPSPKPNGLWLSVEDGSGWGKWCSKEGFGLKNLKCKNEIQLNTEAKILHLNSEDSIAAFSEEFVSVPSWGALIRDTFSIDWKLISENWQGIIIAPYQWSRRLDDNCKWYYGWDCSSGCIWDADATKTHEVVQ